LKVRSWGQKFTSWGHGRAGGCDARGLCCSRPRGTGAV